MQDQGTLRKLVDETSSTTSLAALLKCVFAGNPIPSDIPSSPPWVPDTRRRVEAPFPFAKWLEDNKAAVEERGCVDLFDR